MADDVFPHKPVLLEEVLDLLHIRPDGRYVDATLGLGGHAEAILKRVGPKGRLLGLDVDPASLKKAEDRLQPFEDQTITRRVNFRGLQGVLGEVGWEGVDGILYDLGVSSPQFDDISRGFSFQGEAPLDMRMNPDLPKSAGALLGQLDEKELSDLFYQFGESRGVRRLVSAIVEKTRSGEMSTTWDLKKACERCLGWRGRTHPATRVFLALRCLVNDELGALQTALATGPRFLNVGGRMAFLSFHSLEDRLIKNQFRNLAKMGEGNKTFTLVTKKPVMPDPKETSSNPRARSAKLRVIERAK